jgi:hypothetical protein
LRQAGQNFIWKYCEPKRVGSSCPTNSRVRNGCVQPISNHRNATAPPRRTSPTSGNEKRDAAAKQKYEAELAKYETVKAESEVALKKYAEEQKSVLAANLSPAALRNYLENRSCSPQMARMTRMALTKASAWEGKVFPRSLVSNSRLHPRLSVLSAGCFGIRDYDAVIFANTTGDLSLPDPQAFIYWVKAGHGFCAMHSGSDTFHKFPPYIEMLGGEFKTHGPQVTVTAINKNSAHPATKHLPAQWELHDEIYEFKSHEPANVNELLSMDKHPQTKAPGYAGMSWYRTPGKGRVFYTSLGHREDMWDPAWKDGKGERKNPPASALAYQQHILGGIQWALGLEKQTRAQLTIMKPILAIAFACFTVAAAFAAEDETGFVPLFNGKDTAGWHLRRVDGHNSWSVQPGGVLKNTVNPGEHGTDLVTDQKFWNFTEFMTPDDSNSGFYLRGRHELQILGDYKSGQIAKTGNGAIYDFKAPDVFATRPGGEWQTVEATIIGNRITVFLNGKKTHDNVECNRATGSEIDRNVTEPGPIFLQGDHGTVSFRKMRIKELAK